MTSGITRTKSVWKVLDTTGLKSGIIEAGNFIVTLIDVEFNNCMAKFL